MKRLMIMVSAAVSAACVGAADVTYTSAEYAAMADAIHAVAQTNKNAASELFRTNGIRSIALVSDLVTQAKEIDARLGADGVACDWTLSFDAKWPFSAVSRNQLAVLGAETNCPTKVSLARKYGTSTFCHYFVGKATVDELVNELSELCRPHDFTCCEGDVREVRNEIQKRGERLVKKYLRSQGKSFVTKDGVNPCAQHMEELTTALNAPRFSGLNEWLAKVGVTARLDTSKLLSDAEVAEIKEAALVGDVEMNVGNRYMLMLCLGVDGYNAFVKEYNGEN